MAVSTGQLNGSQAVETLWKRHLVDAVVRPVAGSRNAERRRHVRAQQLATAARHVGAKCERRTRAA